MNILLNFFLVFIIILMWGSSGVAIKMAISTIPPIFATSLRFLVSSFFMLIASYITNDFVSYSIDQINLIFFLSIFYFALPFSSMLYGSKFVNLFVNSFIFSNTPLAVFLINFIVFKKKINFFQKLGVILSLFSFFSFIMYFIIFFNKYEIFGLFLLIFTMLSHASIYVYTKKKCNDLSILSFNTLPSLFAGLILGIFGFFFEKPIFLSFSLVSIMSILYLGIFVGFLGILCYFFVQKKISSFSNALIFIIFPFFSLILDKFFYNSYYDIYLFIFLIPSFLGILMITLKNN